MFNKADIALRQKYDLQLIEYIVMAYIYEKGVLDPSDHKEMADRINVNIPMIRMWLVGLFLQKNLLEVHECGLRLTDEVHAEFLRQDCAYGGYK